MADSRKVIFFDNVDFRPSTNEPSSASSSVYLDPRGIYFTSSANTDNAFHIAHGSKIYTLGSSVKLTDSNKDISFVDSDTTSADKILSNSYTELKYISDITADQTHKEIEFTYSKINLSCLIDAINSLHERVNVLEGYHSIITKITPTAPAIANNAVYTGSSMVLFTFDAKVNETAGCIYQYKINNADNWADVTSTNCTVSFTNAGTYTIYWREKATAQQYEVSGCDTEGWYYSTSTCTISKSQAKATLTLVSDIQLAKDESAQKQLISKVAINGDVTVYLAVSNVKNATDTDLTWVEFTDDSVLTDNALKSSSATITSVKHWYVFTKADDADNYAGWDAKLEGSVTITPFTETYYTTGNLPNMTVDAGTTDVAMYLTGVGPDNATNKTLTLSTTYPVEGAKFAPNNNGIVVFSVSSDIVHNNTAYDNAYIYVKNGANNIIASSWVHINSYYTSINEKLEQIYVTANTSSSTYTVTFTPSTTYYKTITTGVSPSTLGTVTLSSITDNKATFFFRGAQDITSESSGTINFHNGISKNIGSVDVTVKPQYNYVTDMSIDPSDMITLSSASPSATLTVTISPSEANQVFSYDLGTSLDGVTLTKTDNKLTISCTYFKAAQTGTLYITSKSVKSDGEQIQLALPISVSADAEILGYYAFKAKTAAEIGELTEDDFTALTSASSEVSNSTSGTVAVVLTKSSTAPVIKYYSAALGQWASDVTMRACNNTSMGGAQKTFGDGSTYYAWYTTTKLGLDTTYVSITIHQ